MHQNTPLVDRLGSIIQDIAGQTPVKVNSQEATAVKLPEACHDADGRGACHRPTEDGVSKNTPEAIIYTQS